MKKIIALLLACLMVVGLFAACAPSTNDNSTPAANDDTTAAAADDTTAAADDTTAAPDAEVQDVALTVWGPQAVLGENNDGWLPEWCEKFNEAHPEWNITFTYEVCGAGDAGTNVTKDPSVAGDIYFFANDQIGTLLQAEAIARLGGATLEQVQADNTAEIVASVTSGEGVYGVPFTTNTWFMYYDKSVFSEEDVKSLDTMLEVAGEKGVKVSFPMTTGWYFGSFYAANGGTFFGDGTDASQGIQFGGENGVAVTNYLVDLVANPNFMLDAGGAGMSGLTEGTVKAYFSGTWDAANVYAALGDNWAATTPPTITIDGEAKQLLSFGGSKAIGVNPHSEYPQVAAALAAYLATPEAQLAHYEFNGTAPVSVSLMAENADIASNPAFAAAVDTVGNTSIAQPSIPEMNAYWGAAESMANAIYNGEVTHDNAEQKTADFNTSLNDSGL